jgi:hypothetical protein
MIGIAANIERGFAASHCAARILRGVLDKRAARIVISELGAESTAARPTRRFRVPAALPAGAEITTPVEHPFGLLASPASSALVRDRSLMRGAIEEGLRWEPPLTGIARTAMRDVEVCGVEIPAGSPIGVCMGAANRDPARFTDPDRFDLAREVKPHLAFATGPHTCLGLHLARMETRVALNALFDRLPGLRLDPAAEDVHITGLTFRAARLAGPLRRLSRFPIAAGEP